MVALMILSLSSASAQSVTLSGACPGPMTIQVSGITPGGTVALLTGDAPGADPMPAGPCAGASSGLAGGLTYRTSLTDSDGDGVVTLSPSIPGGACGLYLTAVDTRTCRTSRAVEIAGDVVAPNPECGSYRELSDYWRNIRFNDGDGGIEMCDDRLPAGWYRFTGEAGTMMPERAPGTYACGTDAPGWLNARHPAGVGETLRGAQVCFQWSGRDCNWSELADVTNCGPYYVYNFRPVTWGCMGTYCGS